ncbi:endonuclease/exonuclease/phosphatase family protein [Actinokineospora iranica]|uniref:endonuclease/exonuclease/phosphatase family protein n=1 Tax=Actinokineospora iranica TaxID=1271860 RepID=UPI000B884D0B|nr:endonuclease/exonuclease/phosphatase family protein [Actinokineospora iranica]
MITVATWNVLHRVHAENWGEDVVRRWPDESARIAAVTARVAGVSARVIAMQEVSGDQLAALRRALPDRTVHTLRYPRVPRPRQGDCALRDPDEHLVLLVDGPSQEIAAEPFPDDPGKGALAVDVSGTLVVATHLSTDRRGLRQLTRLAGLAAPGPTAVLLGDFNTDRATVLSVLGADFTAAEPAPDALPTRPSATESRPQRIDHVVARGMVADSAVVEDADGLSDHNLVRAAVRSRG